MTAIKFWKETDVQVVNGQTNTFVLDPRTNLVQIINRKDGGGGNIFADNRSSVSMSNYVLKVEQGKTGNIVRPYPLQTLNLVTDAGSMTPATIIEVEVEDLGVVYNASQVLQIQGSVQVVQPISINDTNTEVAEGAANPAKAFLMAGTDGVNSHYLQVDASKNLKILVDGTDATGVNQLAGGVGVRGWLSGIFSKLSNTLTTTITGALPTGANTIGNVGLNAGANAIGTVGVTSLPGSPAQDGTDATGINQLTGGAGIRGWLSGIFSKLSNTLNVNQIGTSLGKSATAAANTAVTLTIAGVSGKQVIVRSIHLGFSGASPASPVQATISDGTNTHYMAVPAQGVNYDYNKGVAYTIANTVTITLPAGGAGAIGNVMIEYDQY